MFTVFVTPKFKDQTLEGKIIKVKQRSLMARKDEVAQRHGLLSERTSSHIGILLVRFAINTEFFCSLGPAKDSNLFRTESGLSPAHGCMSIHLISDQANSYFTNLLPILKCSSK